MILGEGTVRNLAATIMFAFLALLAGGLVPAHADNFPSRSITLIVPFPPGGSTDVAARIMADKMGEALGQAVAGSGWGGSRAQRRTATPSTSASGTPMSGPSSTISITIYRPTSRRSD